MFIQVTVKGTKPLLQHNGRLADPRDSYTRQLKALTGKRKKTDEDLAAIAAIEARGSAYETADGVLGMQTDAIWSCVHEAAKAFKLGKDVERALLPEPDEVVPLLVPGGEEISVDRWLEDEAHIDYRPVVIAGRRTMRARCRVEPPWSSDHVFELLDDVVDLRNLQPVFERAGRLVGLGDWRPRYGRFEVNVAAI